MKQAQPSKILTNVLGAVNDVKFSPDGKLLAVAGGQPSARGDLRLFQTADWKLVATLGGHTDCIASVAFTYDSAKLASASFDHTVRLWDVPTAKLLGVFTGHSDFVYSVAFEPKGQWFVTGSNDRTCRIVELATLKSRLTLSGTEQEVFAVAVSPDGSMIVSSGGEPQFACWNAQTGERLRKIGGHGESTLELAFSLDGSAMVSCGGDQFVRLTDGKVTKQSRTIVPGSVVYAAAIRGDGKQIAGGCFDGQIRIWESATGRELGRLMSFFGPTGEPQWLALTPEGFVNASSATVTIGVWKAKGQAWDVKKAWGTLHKPDVVRNALRGEKPMPPEFTTN